ncbi:transcriptional regulator, GntR family [Alkaliphilus metalliredigens QYMF]|uniref:Transcriptional regulator, GntR family n=1 Tax=Alkaliphilus metalliredigens (strain QYMF) TaxID=293826 RepID=A6TME3_ALKMQ|nr:GntR family transcriptional regulator [Alkaliphilus metalliredigens]ABR47361.1 transcriptional regulator, GntR family [Alkaliphilus metalliredigens QYMF]
MGSDIESIIVDQLMNDIYDGKYLAKEKLPSEYELSSAYKVSRMIVRKAYIKLQEMGYIYSVQGKGRYLKNRSQLIELTLNGSESFTKKMLDKGYNLETKNIFCTKIKYEETIHKELGVKKEAEVYKIGRLRIVDSRPIALHVSYVAKSLFKDIEESGKAIQSMFDYYRGQGYEKFESNKSILSIQFATLKERELLCCPDLVPLLIVETNCIDSIDNRMLEYTRILYRGDSFKYIVE